MKPDQLIPLWVDIASPESWRELAAQFPLLQPFEPRGPQPGYVGADYTEGAVLVMGQNPRLADSQRGFKAGDDRLYALQARLIETKSLAAFDELMVFQKEFMSTWDIFRAIEFPQSFSLDWSQTAYVNSLQCPTRGDDSDAKTWNACATVFLKRQIDALRPDRVICLSAVARDLMKEMFPRIAMEWMPHPTGRFASANRGTMQRRLEVCRAFTVGPLLASKVPPAGQPKSIAATRTVSARVKPAADTCSYVLDRLKDAFGAQYSEKQVDHTFKLAPGATIYVRKSNLNLARIMNTAVLNFPNGHEIEKLFRATSIPRDKSDAHLDFLVGPEQIDAVIAVLKVERRGSTARLRLS